MQGKRWRWILRIVFGLLLGVATAFLGYEGAKVTHERAGNETKIQAQERNRNERRTDSLVIAAASFCGLAAAREVAGGLSSRFGDDRTEAFKRRMDNELGRTWRRIATKQKRLASCDELGLHVWLIPRWHWRYAPVLVRDRLPESMIKKIPTPAMWRPARLRHVDQVDPTHIRWRRGRGVIGRCWAERTVVSFSVAEDWRGLEGIGPEGWKQMRKGGDPRCMGLNFEQFTRLRQQYVEVVAVPIHKELPQGHNVLVGCVVADIPTKAAATSVDLRNPKLIAALRRAANYVSGEIPL